MEINNLKLTKNVESLTLEVSQLIDKIYPIGSIYISVNNVNPKTFLGGNWERWGNGRMPIGVNESDTTISVAEKTGGEKTHKLTVAELASHTHTFTGSSHTHTYAKSNATSGSTTLTIDQIPNHSHNITTWKYYNQDPQSGTKVAKTYDSADFNSTKTETGFIGGGKGHTHSVSTANTNTGGTTQGGSNSSTGSGTAHNNMPPFISCFMWKRIA